MAENVSNVIILGGGLGQLLMGNSLASIPHEPLHVRDIIRNMNFSNLIQRKVIPDLTSYLESTAKRYPKWVYKELKQKVGDKVFSIFGLFMDGLVRKMISDTVPVNWGGENVYDSCEGLRDSDHNWMEIAYPLLRHVTNCQSLSPAIIKRSYLQWGSLAKKVGEWFGNCRESQVTFNQEFCDSDHVIQGHPDIVTVNSIIDIKTTGNFKKMGEESFLQILSYVALMRANNRQVDYMGVLLPMQMNLLMINVKEWNSTNFLQELVKKSRQKQQGMEGSLSFILGRAQALDGVGTTLAKGNSTIYDTLEKYVLACEDGMLPAQIFIGGNLSSIIHVTDSQLAMIANLISRSGLPVFIHAPYSINLSRPWTNKDPSDKTWAIRSLMKQLEIGVAMGCRGVVVHVGKPKDIPVGNGLQIMELSIRQSLKVATEDCPLLLETPVGCGSELCWQIQDMSSFYQRFSDEERRRFKICVDTCHVFVAGYDPLEYLKEWDKLHGASSIGLIHYNDSWKEKGCHADGHAQCGKGNIGIDTMIAISAWGRHHNLSMVTE